MPLVLNTRASIKDIEEAERKAFIEGDTEKMKLLRELLYFKRRVQDLEEEVERLTRIAYHNFN